MATFINIHTSTTSTPTMWGVYHLVDIVDHDDWTVAGTKECLVGIAQSHDVAVAYAQRWALGHGRGVVTNVTASGTPVIGGRLVVKRLPTLDSERAPKGWDNMSQDPFAPSLEERDFADKVLLPAWERSLPSGLRKLSVSSLREDDYEFHRLVGKLVEFYELTESVTLSVETTQEYYFSRLAEK